jgi:hypothetical protein
MQKNILVVGSLDNDIVDYVLGLSERMGYGVIALGKKKFFNKVKGIEYSNKTIEEISKERHIEFILNGSKDPMENISLPVFTLSAVAKRNDNLYKTITYGIGTIVLYAAVFLNSSTILNFCAKGGWYATLPILTVFVFSFVHGNFSHNIWEMLGIQAIQKPIKQVSKVKRVDRRPRLSLNI